MCPCSSTSWKSAIISSEVHRRKKDISLQAIKYDRGRSEDEFEKVIAAYLHVRAGTDWVLCCGLLCMHFDFIFISLPIWTGRHDGQVDKGADNIALDMVNLQ